MSNLIFGLENMWMSLVNTGRDLIESQITWGFAFGFMASTVIHLLVISDHPKRIPHIVSKSLKDSYQHLNPEDSLAPGYKTLDHFKREYHRVRIVVASTSLILAVIIILAVVRW